MYKKILETISDIICIADENDNIIYNNCGSEKLKNLTLIGKNVYQDENGKMYILQEQTVFTDNKKCKLRHYKESTILYQTIAKYQTDTTTGIPNRAVVDQYINKLSLNNKQYIVAMIDIDFFKKINDTYGHLYGDAVLAELASLLKVEVEEEEGFIGRYGGEEFLVIFNLELGASLIKLELLRNKIENHFQDSDNKITVSIGVAQYNGEKSILETVKEADKALYYVKENGRNNIGFWKNNNEITLLRETEIKTR